MSIVNQSTNPVNPEFWAGFQLYADHQPAAACTTDLQRQGWQYGLHCEAAFYGVSVAVLAGAVRQ